MKSPSNKKYRVCFIVGNPSQKLFILRIKVITMNNDIVLFCAVKISSKLYFANVP